MQSLYWAPKHCGCRNIHNVKCLCCFALDHSSKDYYQTTSILNFKICVYSFKIYFGIVVLVSFLGNLDWLIRLGENPTELGINYLLLLVKVMLLKVSMWGWWIELHTRMLHRWRVEGDLCCRGRLVCLLRMHFIVIAILIIDKALKVDGVENRDHASQCDRHNPLVGGG